MNAILRIPDWVRMDHGEYCDKYADLFLDKTNCVTSQNTKMLAVFVVTCVAVFYFPFWLDRRNKEPAHVLVVKPEPTLTERFFEALKTRIPEHTHELSDRNPFKKMAKLFNGVQSAKAVWRRIRG